MIFIGGWLQEMRVVSAREGVFGRLLNKRGSFFHLGFIARDGRVLTREHRGAIGGDICGSAGPLLPGGACVLGRLLSLSCVEASEAGPRSQQEAMIPSGCQQGLGFIR